ncbi:MAG: polyhydroxyalkanoate synthesis regulator DNA-binding domain-containing protein [Phycisphaerae bacterium]
MVEIKKYSNRRFYDATHSTHISLAGIHELICNGEDVRVVDSKSGSDITNAVLAQIILEQESAKLEVIPSQVLHTVIRTKRNMLGSAVDGFFKDWMSASRDAQTRWMELMSKPFGGALNPFGWPGTAPNTKSADNTAPASPESPPSPPKRPNPEHAPTDEVAELRAQLAALAKRLDDMDE